MTKVELCFELGEVLPSAESKGEQSGVSLFGGLAEIPIFRDYLEETHGVTGTALLAVALLDTDWWDALPGGAGKASLFDFLTRHHRHLKLSDLQALDPQPARPDILTRNGLVRSAVPPAWTRDEYYEIKPDSDSGRAQWFGRRGQPEKGKRLKLRRFQQAFALPYVEGVTYPAAGVKRLPLPGNRAFRYLSDVLIGNGGLGFVRISITVRRHSPGLLVYKLCVELEDCQRQEELAKAVAKHLFAAYVVCHYPERFAAIEPLFEGHSLRGRPFPRVRCRFEVIPELRPALNAIEDAVTMRGLALPGETYLLCADECFYRSIVATPPEMQIRQLWAQLQAKAESYVGLVGGTATWSKVKPLMLEVEMVAKHFAAMFPDAEDFVNAVLSWVAGHPWLSVGIVVSGVVVTAAVAAYLEPALLSAAAIGSEAVLTGTGVADAGSSLGLFAMTEQVAAPLFGADVASVAASRGLLSSAQVAAQIGGTGLAANDGLLLANALARPLLSTAVARTAAAGAAAAALLMVSSSTAYAAGRGASTVDAKTAKVLAQHASRLYMVRSQEPTTYQYPRPVPGRLINVHDYAEPAVRTTPNFDGRPPALPARYLGRLVVS